MLTISRVCIIIGSINGLHIHPILPAICKIHSSIFVTYTKKKKKSPASKKLEKCLNYQLALSNQLIINNTQENEFEYMYSGKKKHINLMIETNARYLIYWLSSFPLNYCIHYVLFNVEEGKYGQ